MTDQARSGYTTQRDYTTVLEAQVEEGIQTMNRPSSGQLLSALTCGLDLGIGPFLLLAMGTMMAEPYGPAAKLLMAAGYTFGFIFVVLGRSELFTEHTTLAVLPVLEGRSNWRELGRLWFNVYWGNFFGGLLFAGFAVVAGPSLGVIDPGMFRSTARTFIDLSPTGVFTGAILAGWLMGLLSWILTSVGDTVSRIIVIFVVTFVIGFAHLPHCVAGNIEVVAGMLMGANISIAQWAQFMTVTTVGNVVGGVVFVSLLKYAHVVRGSGEARGEDVDITQDDLDGFGLGEN